MRSLYHTELRRGGREVAKGPFIFEQLVLEYYYVSIIISLGVRVYR
jgi:hypothetical protein